VLFALNWALGVFVQPKTHPLRVPSGRTYQIISDLVASDGRYYLVYDASGSSEADLSHEADDLLDVITRNPRSHELKTIGIEAERRFRFGVFAFGSNAGFVYERSGDQWRPASPEAIRDHMRAVRATRRQ
jgi:hypothetical protein